MVMIEPVYGVPDGLSSKTDIDIKKLSVVGIEPVYGVPDGPSSKTESDI